MSGESARVESVEAVPVGRRPSWPVQMLWSFSRLRPLAVLASVVAVGVGAGSQSTAIGVLAGLATGGTARFGFPRWARHLYTREGNRTRPHGS